MTTIKDIAKEAKVSVATVSRAINPQTSALVAETTRKKVHDIIKKHNYIPDDIARSLSVKKTHTVGLVLPFSHYVLGSDYYIILIMGIVEALSKRGYDAKLFMMREDDSINDEKFLHGRSVDGVLLISSLIKDKLMRKIKERNIPFVLVNNRADHSDAHYVYCDNFNSAYDAVSYLATLGHKEIAMIRGLGTAKDAEDRYKGYQAALSDSHIQFDEKIVAASDFTEGGGYKAMGQILETGKKPTATFCANDEMAIGAIQYLQKNGMKCPEEMAIIGFDDIRIASYINPPLTTIRQPVFELGRAGGNMVVDLIEKKPAHSKSIIIPTELVIRKSCGVDVA